ncbi:MAG: type II secretion system F family protein [Micropruina sp.]|uniref:type II secretion system F family protein n=1 Tax=Micropruina sp. TaxID=2737536 RepID=UPI0039E4D379
MTADGLLVVAVAASMAAVFVTVVPDRLLPPREGPVAGRPSRLGLRVAARRRSSGAGARAELASALPVICAQLAVCLEAGLPLRGAVAALAEGLDGAPAAALRRLDAAVRLGVPEDTAWAELAEAHPALACLVRELRHASSSGVSLGPLLRRHAREAQEAVRGAAQSRARQAGVGIVLPLVACFLPAFLLVGVVPIVGGVLGRLFG